MTAPVKSPATPLPWRVEPWTSHGATSILADDQTAPLGKVLVADCEAYEPEKRVADAAYLAHAANAYPKVIAKAHDLIYRLRIDSRTADGITKHETAAALEKLLRELGEAPDEIVQEPSLFEQRSMRVT